MPPNFHTGPPPHIGWWNASITCRSHIWRWWNGRNWSEAALSSASAKSAGDVATRDRKESAQIFWSRAWPEGASVPRINPETGEVTGGKA